ncbi:ATP-grasp domain-containing protein [Hyphomicrobium sp.]|uniref:ATP-grasp domain-containing protein n=1 Tax=Hyphomicrobium sp. TaxID=82 RepID=UPI0025C305FC|nr:ATP-grasp domain-containing protein [Hyphomicrobium sp.]MCC7250341.1 ATP-grasp domain-containing protein [Hyphomicrobium sp.]
MSGEAVLIAAFSARALAASARRAGYRPLVVDCFGDTDTVALAEASRCLPARVQVGFTTRPLLAALESLEAEAPSKPIGLVLGAGFECNPRLVAKLGERFPLIGNDAETIRRAKDPQQFFSMLDDLGVPHPETRLDAPDDPEGWLMKRVGGSGGLHIHRCPAKPRPDKRRYFQRRGDGEAISLMGLVSEKSAAFAASRQWTSPLARRPFRYGGAAGSLPLDEDLEARLIEMSLAVAEALSLSGIVSFDYLVHDGTPVLLEVNPRPGATLDVFDDAQGTLFKAHVEASQGGDPAALLAAEWHPPVARAAAFLYADRGPLTAGNVAWPEWAADRPQPGSAIGAGQPLATVIVEGERLEDVEASCVQRLGMLETLLYDTSNQQGARQ